MAIRLSLFSSAPVLSLSQASNRGPRNSRLVKCASNHIPINLQENRSSDHKIKVFEDISAGIVCYKDENGEVTCEGYDEGPRIDDRISRFTSNSRNVEIIDLLQRCWIHVADEKELNTADKGIAGQKGIKL